MNFSTANDAPESNFTPKTVYLGKVAYNVLKVNPNNEELKEMGQYTTEEEPKYTYKQEIDGKEYDAANIVVFMAAVHDNSIIDRVSYRIVDNVRYSATGKYEVINKYGSASWATQEDIDAKTMPENMKWYLNEGVRKTRRGEESLVKFIRALRNYNAVTNKSTQEDKDKFVSQFREEDLVKLLKGDFKDIRTLITANPDMKVGFLLGAKSSETGKTYQDMFKEYPMRPYQVSGANNDYLIKEVTDAQSNNRYGNTFFDLKDLSYREYNYASGSIPKPDDQPVFNAEDDSDLPF